MRNILLLITTLLLSLKVGAQTIDQHAHTPTKSPIEGGNSKQQRKADKKKEKQKEELQDAIKEGKKRHLSYQEKATRRRMKRSKKKARDWNNQ
ncbi:MAG: hypothetical protein ACKO1U_05040 [Bacteroidota bacterium]